MADNPEKRNGDTRILESITTMSGEVIQARELCQKLQKLMDEGAYKLDAVRNIINSMKTREQNILNTGGEQAVIQQMNEEQINSFLEMLKSPTFQSLARQLLVKWTAAPQTQVEKSAGN